MIYTVTLNPSLDYIVGVENYRDYQTNRTKEEMIFPGGKGINVSQVLRNLEVESIPLGFVGGFTGQELERRLKALKINGKFIPLSFGETRINVKIRHLETDAAGIVGETEINGKGPYITKEECEAFLEQTDNLREDDYIVLSGSIPETLPDTIYRDILAKLEPKGVRAVVDATGDLLLNTLVYHPFLIKPNHKELGQLFDTEIRNREDAILYAQKLREKGAENVLVSMAEQGAILVTAEDVHFMPAPKGTVVNSVGAGDSMVAGFLYGFLKNSNYLNALAFGVCVGSASAFSSGLATKKQIYSLWEMMHGCA